MIAGSDRNEVALAREVLLLARTVAEIEIAAEHEGFVMRDIHHHRQVRCADEEHAFGTAAVEVATLGI